MYFFILIIIENQIDYILICRFFDVYLI